VYEVLSSYVAHPSKNATSVPFGAEGSTNADISFFAFRIWLGLEATVRISLSLLISPPA
jgi:hypothetical protein